MSLHIGMTTAPRPDPYVGRAYSSLRAAGFDQPLHLFMEPGSPFTAFEPRPDDVVRHFSAATLGCFQNWRRGLATLVRDASPGDWILMLQDDVVWNKGSRRLLEDSIDSWELQAWGAGGFGFASPYTSPAMVPRGFAPDDPSESAWVEAKFYNNAFWGALALLFPLPAAQALLTFPRFVAHDHHRKLDVVVGNCMRDMGRTMLVAVPSVCDHVGEYSTLGRHKFKGNRWGRRGYRFDAAREYSP